MIKKVIDEVFVKATVSVFWLSKNKTELEKNQYLFKRARELKDEIERHCDSFEDLEVDSDSHWECTFCGCQMAAADDYQCCEESISEYDKLEKEKE